jgi:putative DNA-invertase from lambdoid prophage Rac
MAATAQANAEAIKEAQRGGIALAKEKEAATKYRGRKPSFTRDQFSIVCDMLDLSTGVGQIAATTGLSRQTIYRIRDDRACRELPGRLACPYRPFGQCGHVAAMIA